MAKSRDKLQQVGFWDEEVSKPDHDEVVQWAYRNAEYIFRAACPTLFDRQWTLKDVSWFSPSDEESGREAAETFMAKTPRPNPQIKRKWLEQVISTQTDQPTAAAPYAWIRGSGAAHRSSRYQPQRANGW